MSPRIQQFLSDHGVAFRLHAHAPIGSFESAKAVLPFDPDTMVKGLAFRLPGGGYAIAAMRGADRADYKKIADTLSIRRADLRAAAAEDLANDLDMMPGGVAPLPIAGAVVVFDRAVLALDTIYCGTGRTDTTLEIAGDTLIRIAGGRVEHLTKLP
jgi:Cys-tRNA(Pro)/Cys-tRNA(Cys) deacylase